MRSLLGNPSLSNRSIELTAKKVDRPASHGAMAALLAA